MLKDTARLLAAAATFATAAATGISHPGNAFADPAVDVSNVSPTNFGTQALLNTGGATQGWTISNLKPSSDAIPYQAHGTLWEATATDEAIQGNATPIVYNLNARAPGGQTYPALFQVATPEGVNPAGLTQGQKTSGKVYFDVTGDNPDSVAYIDGGRDLLSWAQTSPSRGGAGGHVAPLTAGDPATPLPAGNPVTGPRAAGAAGTPIPAGAHGTPIAPGAEGTPIGAATPGVSNPVPAAVPGAQGAPLPGEQVPTGAPGSPPPAGASGVPLPGEQAPAGAPASPAPAAGPESPAAQANPANPAPAAPAPANEPTGAGPGAPAAPANPASPAPAAPTNGPAGPNSAAPAGGPGPSAGTPAT